MTEQNSAEAKYKTASELFAKGEYEASLRLLDGLLATYHDSASLLKARERCLDSLRSRNRKAKKIAGIALSALAMLAVGAYFALARDSGDADIESPTLLPLTKKSEDHVAPTPLRTPEEQPPSETKDAEKPPTISPPEEPQADIDVSQPISLSDTKTTQENAIQVTPGANRGGSESTHTTPVGSVPRTPTSTVASAQQENETPMRENTESASKAGFSISLGAPEKISYPGIYDFEFMPDGHICVIPDFPDGSQFQMYWAGRSSSRTVGKTSTTMSICPNSPVIGPGRAGSFDNHGAWLYSVHRTSGANLAGFYHAEDTEWSGDPNEHFIAYKSGALAVSSDNGLTWKKKGQFLTSEVPKPRLPAWVGEGDFCVVRDPDSRRWYCFYSRHFLRLAISDDPEAKPGTWYKYYNGSFTESALGGKSTPLSNLCTKAGGNPSVHYNTYLKCWVMVWHDWDYGEPSCVPNLWLSTSQDLLNWLSPMQLTDLPVGTKAWNPTIVGASDTEAGEEADLYYGFWPNKCVNVREFVRRRITFHLNKQ